MMRKKLFRCMGGVLAAMSLLLAVGVQTPVKANAAMWGRDFVEYVPSYCNVNLTYAKMGQVTLDNLDNSGPAVLVYEHTTSGSVQASLAVSSSFTAEVDGIVAKCSAECGISVGTSTTWSAGTQTGASMTVDAGMFGNIIAYRPGVSTGGGLKYKVYNLNYPDNYWYETKSVGNSYLPATSYIHYVNAQKPFQF